MKISEMGLDVGKPLTILALFDGSHTLANGDPDNENRQRTTRIRGKEYGYMSYSSINRKIRDYIETFYPDEPNGGILVSSTMAFKDAVRASGCSTTEDILTNYSDARMFGGTFTNLKWKNDEGGDINLVTATSALRFSEPVTVHPIQIEEKSIARKMPINAEGEGDAAGKLGRSSLMIYGAFQMFGEYWPMQGAKNGVTTRDLELYIEAASQSLDQTGSQSRDLRMREVILIVHSSKFVDKSVRDWLKASATSDSPTSYADISVEFVKGDNSEGTKCYRKVIGTDDWILV